MSLISEKHLSDIISKVATACNLQNWRHSVQNFECIGQNYFGVVIPISLIDCDERTFPIVLKLAPTDERYRVSGAVTLMFRREVFVYSKLLQSYNTIQGSYPLSSQYVIPKLYYTCDEYCNEVIAMEDMTHHGYKPYIDRMFLDLIHVTIGLKALAKLHALSFILQAKDAIVFEEVAKECVPLTEIKNKRYIDIMIDRLNKAIVKFEGTMYVTLFEKLRNNCGIIFQKEIELTLGKCIGHGDVWKENILFKYEGDTPTSACLIDYQTTRITSPAFDTLFLIISSTDTQLRKSSFHDLLNIYYKTFDDFLKLAGLESQTIYSYEKFEADLKTVGPSCLIVANTALWLSHGLQQEGHVRSKQVLNTDEEITVAANEYKNVIQAIVEDFYCYGYLPR